MMTALLSSFLALATQAPGMHLVDAIALVETGAQPHLIGDNGRALGAWQFHRATWDHTTKMRKAAGLPTASYRHATHWSTARQYAHSHLQYLRIQLAFQYHREPTVAELYAAWNLGLTGFRRRGYALSRVPGRTWDTAERVTRLLQSPL